jgi:hypothetical protein
MATLAVALCRAADVADNFDRVDQRSVPHSPQNLNCGGFSEPHLAQRFFSGAPQSPQNLVASGFSELQLRQRICPKLRQRIRPLLTTICAAALPGSRELNGRAQFCLCVSDTIRESLVFPEVPEPAEGQFGIADSVLSVLVA